MRLFLAIPLPADQGRQLSDHLASSRRQAPDLKWVDPLLYHFTLLFLGDVEPAQRERLEGELAGLAAPDDFALRLGEPLTLPDRAPRVLAFGLAEGAEHLAALAGMMADTASRAGLDFDRRPFRAHLTVARSRRGVLLPELSGLAAPSWPAFQATACHLYRSHLRQAGPVYESIWRLPLAGA